MDNIQDLVAKTTKELILTEPFYGLFLIGINKKFTDQIPTAGVSKHGIGMQLTINPEFYENLTKPHRVGLIKHELLHIAFGHLIMRDLYSDHKLFNIAADLEINQYINISKLPEGGLLLSSFPELNLPKKAGTKEYYKLLEQAQEDGTCPALDDLMDKMDGESEYCHSTWNEFDDLSEPDKKLLQKQVEHQLKDAAETTVKKQGSIPGEFKDLIERLFHIEPAKFDWKGYLKRFVGNSSIVYTKKLRRKYNKRYSGSPGLKIKFKNHILVGVDTSGSVNNEELNEFFSELAHMSKTGHKITVAQCDTSLRTVEEFNPKKDWEIHGRGGTSFQPVIDHYNEKGSYTALIYLTDGEAYNPDNCPNNTLWVLSSVSDMNDELPGQVIKLN
ncbi:MAG: putative metal-dependent peptidase [Arcobacteraceae bacterium]|jgi:predicted metal-dependent peptidase|tara:strand:- start:1308 stop:2468 length:1161 start_codon:yes stop_codon:yes gene_type:complete